MVVVVTSIEKIIIAVTCIAPCDERAIRGGQMLGHQFERSLMQKITWAAYGWKEHCWQASGEARPACRRESERRKDFRFWLPRCLQVGLGSLNKELRVLCAHLSA